ARKIDPGNADVRLRLSQAYRRIGRVDRSLENLNTALPYAARPEQEQRLKGELAWELATTRAELRDGAKALRLASEACAIAKSASNLDALAAAQAETGDFSKAAQSAREAQGL